MERKILIKGMVCDRCVRVLTDAFAKEGFKVKKIYLGEALIEAERESDFSNADNILRMHGFQILEDKKDSLLALIHEKIDEALEFEIQTGEHVKIKSFLSSKINKDYNLVSSTFTAFENITIEQFMIRQRIEKAKELIVYTNRSLTDIAYHLGYKNISHLTKQFSTLTGLNPSHYRSIQADKQNIAATNS